MIFLCTDHLPERLKNSLRDSINAVSARSILNIGLRTGVDYISNLIVLKWADITSIESMLLTIQLATLGRACFQNGRPTTCNTLQHVKSVFITRIDDTVLCTPNTQDNRKSTHKSFRRRLSASSVKTSRWCCLGRCARQHHWDVLTDEADSRRRKLLWVDFLLSWVLGVQRTVLFQNQDRWVYIVI